MWTECRTRKAEGRGVQRCLNVVNGAGVIESAALGNTAKNIDKELTRSRYVT
jgi:hypothetical protein